MILLSPQLQAFVAIAKNKTVHAAAKTLHVTQTAITQRIQALEAKLGASLFIRTRRGMTLTPEGEALLRYCHTMEELEGKALATIQGTSESLIQIGITGPTSIMQSRIIPQCLPILQAFPNLLVTFNINDVENRVRALRAGESQFAILRTEDVTPEMKHKILQPEHYVLVCTSAWKSRKLQDILRTERIIDYDPTDQMTFNYLKHFDLFETTKHERHFVNRPEALSLMLTTGLGYGVLTREFSKPYIEEGELIVLNSGKTYQNKLALAWYNRPEPSPYFSKLIEAIT
jgi:DNA-binding transcriptional LysR family regulator